MDNPTTAHDDDAAHPGAPDSASLGSSASSGESAATLGQPWLRLLTEAKAIMRHAYVPYSHFPVGAAALVEDGRVVAGCNVENASYGLTLCAECGLVSSLHASGGGKITHFVCVDGNGEILMPCGRCRQLLYEHRAPGMLLLTVSGVKSMDRVLPDAFGPENL
ncbi:cytidine deaminase [Kocuria sp.]|uniref:cytidine deaminase n=1 Tax=Kocuria sp. TaxID=1871328 RepID=UPI0026DF2BE1|nr:cytidine deaminase [Kocuria sp.]MDO5617547.1 cytidine deaminase [Kocuria sp.]